MINRMRKGSSSGASKKAAPPSTVFYEELFNKFKDSDEASIGPAGMERLCKALSVDPSDVLMLVLAWCLNAGQMGYFSREEWLSGLDKLGSITSEAELKERLEQIHATTLREADALRELHQFTHKFCREERKKNIDVSQRSQPIWTRHSQLQSYPLPSPPPLRGVARCPVRACPIVKHRLWSALGMCPGGERANHVEDASRAALC